MNSHRDWIGWSRGLLILTLLTALSPLVTHAAKERNSGNLVDPTRVEIAGLKEDIALLRREVRELTLQIERLSRENHALKNWVETSSNDRAKLQEGFATISDLRREIEALRVELTTEETRRNAEMLSEISRQMVALASQTDEAVNSLAEAINAQPEVKKPVHFSGDFPKNGVIYTVKRGDTLSEIATVLGSTVVDIQNANKIPDPSRLMAGQIIFVPRNEVSESVHGD